MPRHNNYTQYGIQLTADVITSTEIHWSVTVGPHRLPCQSHAVAVCMATRLATRLESAILAEQTGNVDKEE